LKVKRENHMAATDKAAAPTDNDSVGALERSYTPGFVEVRSGGTGLRIGGKASVFNTRSRRLPFGFEIVDPHFFDESRSAGWPNVVARWNHSPFHLLGSVAAGTLELTIDSRGLDYVCDLPECRSDLYELTSRGDVSAASFAFAYGAVDSWSYVDGSPLRTLLSGRLLDVAPVGGGEIPAYATATTAALRSLARHMDAPFEDVKALAEKDELRSLFVRTDRPSPTRSDDADRWDPAAARLYLLNRRFPPAPTSIAATTLLRLHARRMAWH
jgi:HK97 family phage prohead protease